MQTASHKIFRSSAFLLLHHLHWLWVSQTYYVALFSCLSEGMYVSLELLVSLCESAVLPDCWVLHMVAAQITTYLLCILFFRVAVLLFTTGSSLGCKRFLLSDIVSIVSWVCKKCVMHGLSSKFYGSWVLLKWSLLWSGNRTSEGGQILYFNFAIARFGFEEKVARWWRWWVLHTEMKGHLRVLWD